MEQLSVPSSSALTYGVRVCLEGVQPEIWRLLDLSGDLSLGDLHEVIQIAFGWRLGRSHVFIGADGRRWSDGRWCEEGGSGDDERTTSLAQALTPQSDWLAYHYDPRAGWRHLVDLVTIRPALPGQPSAVLVGGARHGPLEDVGGPQGYAELLGDLEDPAGARRASSQKWLDGSLGPWHRSFDPEQLDLVSVNRGLAARFDPDADRHPGYGSQLAALEARMYPGLRREFTDFVAHAKLDQPVLVAPEVAAQMVQPFSWLLGVLDTSEVRLSDSGRLPTKLHVDTPARSRETQVQSQVGILHLLKAALRSQLALTRDSRVELSPTGRRVIADPQQLWWQLARSWLPARRTTAARDASLLLLVELAVLAHVTKQEAADSVAFGLDSLGWVDPIHHASIYEDLVWRLVADDLPLLRALGVIGDGCPDEPLATGPGAALFARAALQADSTSAAATSAVTPPTRWVRRPISRRRSREE